LTNSDPSITWYHRYQIHKHLETLHSKVLIPLTFKNERTYRNEVQNQGFTNQIIHLPPASKPVALAMGKAPPGKAIASYLHSATLFDLVKV
ncbi:MAG: hypothetical protein KME50_32885, partial [Nostoc desertorum CM1-VF14]|nr:hypothetical protein [Nostoc desertorum CM1-VF14]